MCIAAFTLLVFAVPLIALDHFTRHRRRRDQERERLALLKTLFKCSSEQIERTLPVSECCICLGTFEEITED
jgi:hypothetical protein